MKWTSLAAFVMILRFAGAADGLMDALWPTAFLAVGALVTGLAWILVRRGKEEYQSLLDKQYCALDALPDGCDIIDGRVGGFYGSSIQLFSLCSVPAPTNSRVVHGDYGDYTAFSTSICGVRVEWNTVGDEQ